MKLWIAVYSHKHGIDAWPIWTDDRPDEDAIKKEIDFEEPEDGVIDLNPETLDIYGPFDPPNENAA
jgi:hypothetical protein